MRLPWHPLREAENIHEPKVRPYLTYYAFPELVDAAIPMPLVEDGADAVAVHDFLRRAEQHALKEELTGLDDSNKIEAARKAGALLQTWVESVTRFGAQSFLEEAKYFIPIPVALVRIIPSLPPDIRSLFQGNEQAFRFAESVLATISDRSDHAFHLSYIDAVSNKVGISPDDALGVLAILASPSIGILRLDLNIRNTGSSVATSEFVARLRDWWKHRTTTNEEWKEWAATVDVQWVAVGSVREVL